MGRATFSPPPPKPEPPVEERAVSQSSERIVIDQGTRVLFIDNVGDRQMVETFQGRTAYIMLRKLVTGQDGAFLLDIDGVQKLHAMCSQILAKLSAEALR